MLNKAAQGFGEPRSRATPLVLTSCTKRLVLIGRAEKLERDIAVPNRPGSLEQRLQPVTGPLPLFAGHQGFEGPQSLQEPADRNAQIMDRVRVIRLQRAPGLNVQPMQEIPSDAGGQNAISRVPARLP